MAWLQERDWLFVGGLLLRHRSGSRDAKPGAIYNVSADAAPAQPENVQTF